MKNTTIPAVVLLVSIVWAQPPDSLWTCTYDLTEYDDGVRVFQLANGDYLIGGTTGDVLNCESRFVLIRTDDCGIIQWQTIIPETNLLFSDCADVVIEENGNVSLIGTGYYYSDAFMRLVQTDGTGEVLREACFGGGDSTYFGAEVELASDGGYILGGYRRQDWFGPFILIKTDSDWNVDWQSSYSYGAVKDRMTALSVTSDGGYIFAGWSYDGENAFSTIVKTDPEGLVEWDSNIQISGGMSPNDIQQTQDGGYISAINDLVNYDCIICRQDSNGGLLWMKTIESRRASGMIQTPDNGLIVTGEWFPYPGMGRFWMIRLDDQGTAAWEIKYSNPMDRCGYDICENSMGGYTVLSPEVDFFTGASDFLLLCFASCTGIRESDPFCYADLCVSPVPVGGDDAVTILYTIPEPGSAELNIRDLTGRTVQEFNDLSVAPGTHSIDWTPDNLPEGIYIVELSGCDYSVSQSMVLVR